MTDATLIKPFSAAGANLPPFFLAIVGMAIDIAGGYPAHAG